MTKDVMHYRRRRVAALRLRGMTEREIHHALAEGGAPDEDDEPILNPETGRPYSATTVHNDLVAVREAWRRGAADDIAVLKGRELAELRRARVRAWEADDMGEVRRNIETEMKLLGTAAPEKSEQTGIVQLRVVYDERIDGPAEELRRPSEGAGLHPQQGQAQGGEGGPEGGQNGGGGDAGD